MSSVNIHIYPSFFTNESRILREATAIVEFGISDKVILVGLWREGLPTEEQITDSISLIRVKGLFKKKSNSSWANLLVFAGVFLKLIRLSFREKPFAINVHSLTLLPFAVVTKWLSRCALIYDAHELETETHDSRGVRKKLEKIVERFFIRFADHTVVVSHSIENWYRNEYALSKISTIRNIPILSVGTNSVNLRAMLGIKEDALLFVYVGLLAGGRGIDHLLKCFSQENLKDRHVVFIGYGDLEEMIKTNLSSNIHFLPAVPPSQVAAYVAGADVGLSLIEATCLSFYYSLPNKVFEYLSAGIPFVCSDFPDVRREFETYNVCWFTDPAQDLSLVLGKITCEDVQIRRRNVIGHRSRWDWNIEKHKLVDVYASIGKTIDTAK
ncbi:MAG TPA: glycosyltransferase [Ohtaekwangia sp.]|nr:glycosyltransferase [Ohtaekwangia sp.]